MAYDFNVNATPIDGAAAIFNLVTSLLDAGWYMHAYGTGAGAGGARTAGTGAAGHAGENGFAVTSLRDASSAWVALKLPDGSARTVIFQRGTDGGGANYNWWVAWSHGGLNADGDATTVDSSVTAGDRKNIHGEEVGVGGGPVQLFPADDALGMCRCSSGANDAAPYGAYLLGWNKGTGESRFLLLLEPVTANAADDSPWFFFAHYTGGNNVANFANVVSGSYGRSWFKHGLGGAAWVNTAGARFYSDAGSIPQDLTVNPYDSKDDLFFFPLVQSNAGARYKGITLQTAWDGVSRGTATTFDPTGAGDDRVALDNVTVPWPAGVAATV